MILYTIQNEQKYKEFLETGILKAHDNIICFDHDDFKDSYRWMVSKMEELLPKSDIYCNFPLWSWFKHDGKKPDLRKSSYLSKGEIGYLIKFEIDDNKVLLTDFDKWHLILNHSKEELQQKHTIFEIEECDDVEYYLNEGFVLENNLLKYDWNKIILNKNSDIKYIQATIWYIKIDQVKKITKFKSR